MRGNLSLANESFFLTMTDGAPTDAGAQPRSIIIGANHGGEYVDLLRLVPASIAIVAADGTAVARLPALAARGIETTSAPDRLATTTHWSGTRAGSAVDLTQVLAIERGTTWFDFDLHADVTVPIGGLVMELRPPTGVALTNVESANGTAELTFARYGRDEPRLRLDVSGGTITRAPSGGLLIAASGPDLSLRVTDLTAGGASTSLRLLDPRLLIADYDVGAAILRRDPGRVTRRCSVALLLLGVIGALVVPIDGLGLSVAALLALATGVSAFTVVATRGAPSLRARFVRGPLLRIVQRFGLDGATGAPAGTLVSAARDGLGLGLVFHGLSLVMGLALVAAVEPTAVAHPVEILGVLAIARLTLTVPISPNGIGVQEGALAILFVRLGLPPDVALAAALLNRLALLLTAGIGAMALARGARRRPSAPVRPVMTEAAPGR